METSNLQEDPLSHLDLDAILDRLPEFDFDDFFQDECDTPPVSHPSPNPALSEIENLLMSENDVVLPQTPSSESDYDKFLAEILVDIEPRPDSEDASDKDLVDVDPRPDSEDASDKDRTDAATPDDSVSKKQRRRMRNRDSAVKSRERKKLYLKNLEMKTRFFEGECRRLGHLLQCCYAENHALRLCLQSRGAFGASMTMQESAVLLLESLLLGSLLWFMGIMCQLSLPLILCLTPELPRENMEQRGSRKVARKGQESKMPLLSFLKSRRCRSSRPKMKFNFFPVL